MAYRRSNTMYDAMMSGISNLGGIADVVNGQKKQESELKLRAAQLKGSEQNQEINGQTIAKNNETAAQAIKRKQLLGSIEGFQKERMALPVGVRNDEPSDYELQAWSKLNEKPIDEVRANIARTKADASQADLDNKAKRQTLDFNNNLMPMKLEGAKLDNRKTSAEIEESGARTARIGAETAAGPNAKPPTESQSNAALFGRRMELAMSDLEAVKTAGHDASTLTAGIGRKLQKLPGGNMITSDGAQRQRNAETNFLTAVLRKESGASISPSEFSSGEELYFDRTGDSAALKEQKARNRAQAYEGLKSGAGPAWQGVAAVEQGRPAGNLAAASAPASGAVDKRSLAEQALSDPEATEQEKAAARRILGK